MILSDDRRGAGDELKKLIAIRLNAEDFDSMARTLILNGLNGLNV